jgi:bifunctional non-homologous end joining protein LigD
MKKKPLIIGGKELALSNLERSCIRIPASRRAKSLIITPGSRAIFSRIQKSRPITSKRFPNGVSGQYFYEKDAPSFTPRWVKTFSVPRTSENSLINYILINDLPTLVWSANMARFREFVLTKLFRSS